LATQDAMPRSAALREALERKKEARPAATLLSLAEARQQLGIGRTTLYQQMKEGTLAYVKIGRRRLISVKAIERFIERRENKEAEG
jgi:excisionase family DNA binding protein